MNPPGTTSKTPDLTREQKDVLLRWRLCLGRGADRATAMGLTLPGLGVDIGSGALGEGMGEEGMTGMAGEGSDLDLDLETSGLDGQALAELDDSMEFIYGEQRGADLSGSRPYVPPKLASWLANIRRHFRNDVVALVQKDAIERRNLRQLLFEPETLPYLEKNVDLAATLISAKDLIPSKAKDIARQVIAEIVDQIMKELENEVRQVVIGALTRSRHSPLPVYRNIDWKRTIRSNMKNYDAKLECVIPERVYFFGNLKRFHEWRVILAVDQSGSMGTSVVYSSIMAAIFASLPVLETNLILFDTEIVDMTEELSDPVEILFGAQLGGGTDIAKAVTYAASLVTEPEKTIFILITDLYEGGSQERLLATLAELKESRAEVLCLLALTDRGVPSYSAGLAAKVRGLEIPTFGCTPHKLVDILGRILKGVPYEDLATEGGVAT